MPVQDGALPYCVFVCAQSAHKWIKAYITQNAHRLTPDPELQDIMHVISGLAALSPWLDMPIFLSGWFQIEQPLALLTSSERRYALYGARNTVTNPRHSCSTERGFCSSAHRDVRCTVTGDVTTGGSNDVFWSCVVFSTTFCLASSGCTMQVQAAMPQSISFDRWRDETYRRELDCKEGSVGSQPPLKCSAIGLKPALLLPWRYTEEQRRCSKPWSCTAVWLHHAHDPNGTVPSGPLVADVLKAINKMASSKNSLAKTLLVRPDGMPYDRTRFGGNHYVTIESGRQFMFSVRSSGTNKVLLAVAYN